jgi:site-specific recombinase XerD
MASQTLSRQELAEFPQIAVEFQQNLTSVYGRSPKTVFEYMLDLRMFFRYLAATDANIPLDSDEISNLSFSHIDADRLAQVQRVHIISYLYYLSQYKNNSATTRNRKLSALRTFFKFLVQSNLIKNNPTEQVQGPKKRSTLPKHLTLGESIDFLDVVARSDSPTRKRDYAILTLFLNCGMRLSELTGINLTDISQDMRSLRVLGKGNKERIVYLNDACRAALLDYYTDRKDGTPEKMRQKALFLSSRMQRISNKTVQWMVYKYLEAAGLNTPGMSVHKLRHTAATLMYQTGHVDVRVLKEILGHEQLNTTQIYTHVSNKSMEEAVAQNPLATAHRPKPSPTVPSTASPQKEN